MFTVSVRIRKKRFFVCMGFIIALLIGIWAFMITKNVGATGKDNIKNTMLSTNESRIEFLKSFGWEVSAEPTETKEVKLPSKSDEVLATYNKIQLEQGMNIEKYLGKSVIRYTYEVKNYPDKPDGVRANLIVYKEKLIAGDICSNELNGFMHGFKAPQNTDSI